ncbi:uncharacterized protein F4807DRAFT_278957 [Annulohypoxylon truncatum]|uniref:uncharacterized protein n=1 Tax=Annulohypoxylon truncatum TaxID=327061 RepID=UPI002007FD0D|nr:uncharacterized protein F4807DRAFT_278957 [Annulohypoxylon truncatum]KAI1205667.1 hypothetical protein F4807DRAFT_278957 [Annulohypoxylon truncatum]
MTSISSSGVSVGQSLVGGFMDGWISIHRNRGRVVKPRIAHLYYNTEITFLISAYTILLFPLSLVFFVHFPISFKSFENFSRDMTRVNFSLSRGRDKCMHVSQFSSQTRIQPVLCKYRARHFRVEFRLVPG